MLSAGGLAAMLLAASPALCSTAEGATTDLAALAAAPARTATTVLAMNGAMNGAMSAASGPAAFTTAMPAAARCPQAAGQPMPVPPALESGTAAGAKNSPCLGILTGKLLDLAARKAGQILSVPILVF